jgi:uncharacterized protein (TIGR03083 family)
MMNKPSPILIVDRFPALLDTLLELLTGLTSKEWDRPTVSTGWSVKDIALHLLGDEINILSGKRDQFHEPHGPLDTWEELVAFINQRNAQWVEGTRRISPQVLCELLRITGSEVNDYFQTLDVHALGGPVNWAGPDPAPVWLDIAREFTERWHHQQHIRDAVEKPGCTEPYFLAPVLDGFVRALPHTYRQMDAPEGTCVSLTITGASGGVWSVMREKGRWELYSGQPERPLAEVILDENVAWRLFTRGIQKDQARKSAQLQGNLELAEKALDTLSIIA